MQQNQLNKSNYSIYPNPFKESLKIHCTGNFNWQIIDLFGKQIKGGTGLDEQLVNTTDIASGLYLIKIERQNEIAFEKLVK